MRYGMLLGGVLLFAAGSSTSMLLGEEAPAKKGTNVAPVEDAPKAKASKEAEEVSKLHLAHCLIQYGRTNKAPEALVMAARILSEVGTSEMTEKASREQPKEGTAPSKEKSPQDNSPKGLLTEAKKASNDNPTIVALANTVELSRGAVGGPKVKRDTVNGYGTDTYTVAFRGGEVARVAISGDGDTRLDLYVYDENGNLVASRVGPGDDALAEWYPKWTGSFTIRIVNRGSVYNRYSIATN